jgi:N-acetylmuramoyl-L-alanine amidase
LFSFTLMTLSYRLLIISSLLITFYSCTRPPFYQSNKSYKKQAKDYAKVLRQDPNTFATMDATAPYWVGTTNFSMRKPNIVVIHHTAQNSCEQTLKTFTTPSTEVSAHYVICKDGTVHHMLNDYLRAWHGGAGKWGSVTDVNSSSIGIELDNNGAESFTAPQINSLLSLLDTLKHRYAIPTANFIGHQDIAPTRKVDPNVFFPWKTLAQRGFGIWYDEVKDSIPSGFDHLLALKVIGYDIKDTTAAISAFKRKFIGVEKAPPAFTEDEKRILYNLMKKSL